MSKTATSTTTSLILGSVRFGARQTAAARRFRSSSTGLTEPEGKQQFQDNYDAIIIGGGHNGLVSAAYLAKAGKKVAVLERRHVTGGAAVTEEIIPGYRFSRASYLLSLFRPRIIEELELKRHGLKYHIKSPTSFTPIRGSHQSLVLSSDMAENVKQIGQFSKRDAQAYPRYEEEMGLMASCLEPLFDQEPFNIGDLEQGQNRMALLSHARQLYKQLKPLGVKGGMELDKVLLAPISKILDQWFESEPLKATLATDGVIGYMGSPRSPGTGYVLLHHVLGGLDGQAGAWAFVYGGMGAVSDAIRRSAEEAGAEVFTDVPVKRVEVTGSSVSGVELEDGRKVRAGTVLSNATPKVTFEDLISEASLPEQFLRNIKTFDYTSPVTKINVALKCLPNFTAIPNGADKNQPLPHHQTTIHLNCEDSELLHDAYCDAMAGKWSQKPIIEMTLPSSVDRSIVDSKEGHVALLFTQMVPYQLRDGPWTDEKRRQYAETVFNDVEAYAPGFKDSIVGYECLTPPDLERIFGLTGGNIFHGSMSMDQLYHARPTEYYSNYRTPISGLYLCGSGAHPGGGVTGAPGRLAALAALKDGGQ